MFIIILIITIIFVIFIWQIIKKKNKNKIFILVDSKKKVGLSFGYETARDPVYVDLAKADRFKLVPFKTDENYTISGNFFQLIDPNGFALESGPGYQFGGWFTPNPHRSILLQKISGNRWALRIEKVYTEVISGAINPAGALFLYGIFQNQDFLNETAWNLIEVEN